MDAKWPFMIITFGLLFLLGITISKLEKNGVMRNWDKRRCEFSVMTAGMFFKPNDDPRSKAQFASDNFTFCMKSYIDKFIELAFLPFQTLIGKHLGLARDAMDMINVMRNIAKTIYDAFLNILQPYFRRFTASVYEMSRIVQYLRMALRKANAIMLSMLYQGLTVFRGILNTIQFVIKVILIVCGIILAIILVLIFVLFPFIPVIMSTLGAIIAAVTVAVMVFAGYVGKASGMKSGFCFSKLTRVYVKNTDGSIQLKPVSKVQIGDELAFDCGKVTAIICMEGSEVSLYNLQGIYVSGSHVVQSDNEKEIGQDKVETQEEKWNLVENDKRAQPATYKSAQLYCFNTETHKIPVYAPDKISVKPTKRVVFFKDWEEIPDEDTLGQYGWNYIILKSLNQSKSYELWKDGLSNFNNTPLMSPETLIKTSHGYIALKNFTKQKIGTTILDRKGQEQDVLGVIDSIVEDVDTLSINRNWHTELYEWDTNQKVWKKGVCKINPGKGVLNGKTLITESGEIIIWNESTKSEKIVRDFTDIGYKSIHETYPYVAQRLRLYR